MEKYNSPQLNYISILLTLILQKIFSFMSSCINKNLMNNKNKLDLTLFCPLIT